MEDEMTFDIGGLLSEEEADKFFEEIDDQSEEEKESEQETGTESETEQDTEIQAEEKNSPEKVGKEEIEEDTVGNKPEGSSPSILSSIASALKTDGIFPDFTDEELSAVNTAEDFAELVQKAIKSQMDERTRRIDEALGNGVKPDDIRLYEQTLSYLDGISEDSLKAEGEEGDALRKQLIYNDLINRGYTKERASREVEKSLKSGSDIEDAQDALDALRDFYSSKYQQIQDDARARTENAKAEQKKQAEDFKKMVLEDEMNFGETKIDKRTRQRVYDVVSKPVYKDPDTGRLLTEVQRFQKEHPLEFLKQLGMWYVLTDGGKTTSGLTKSQVKAERNKGIRELERKLNSSTVNLGGSLHYDGGFGEGRDDILLSDDWNIG